MRICAVRPIKLLVCIFLKVRIKASETDPIPLKNDLE